MTDDILSLPCQCTASCFRLPLRDVADCSSGMCLHGICLNGTRNYTCECENGWHGRDCDVPLSTTQGLCYAWVCVYLVQTTWSKNQFQLFIHEFLWDWNATNLVDHGHAIHRARYTFWGPKLLPWVQFSLKSLTIFHMAAHAMFTQHASNNPSMRYCRRITGTLQN